MKNENRKSVEGLRVYLLRHGQTDYNAAHVVQGGGIDSRLNATGRQQALAFYRRHRTASFRALHSSALRRTQETLAPFREEGYSLQVHAGLNEYHWGVFEGRPFDEALQKEIAPIREAWAAGDFDYRVPGGESPREVWERAHAALQTIVEENTNGNVLICTHGRMLRIILSNLVGAGLHEMQNIRHHNAALNVLRKTTAGFAAELLNDTSHLSPELASRP